MRKRQMTRREFRASLGCRRARKEGTKAKRLKDGSISKPMRRRYAVLVKEWIRRGRK